MAKIKLDLTNKSIADKLSAAQTIITHSTNNANLPDVNPATVVALNAARYSLQVAAANVASARQKVTDAVTAQTQREQTFDAAFSAHGAYVQDRTGGDAAKITSTGFGVAAEGGGAPIALTAPEHFDVTAGDEAGELNADWDSMKGAAGYETESTTDTSGATGWTGRTFSKKSQVDLKGLTSGTQYAVRTRAVGSGDPGPWSQIVLRRAP